jgi:hypothetical protein
LKLNTRSLRYRLDKYDIQPADGAGAAPEEEEQDEEQGEKGA